MSNPNKNSEDLWQAVLNHLKRLMEKETCVITDADMNRIETSGRTADGKLLLLGEVLDKKGVAFKDFFTV